MPNIQDYVLWRGDLPVGQVPLCDVDALLLSYLAYMRYDGIVGAALKERASGLPMRRRNCLTATNGIKCRWLTTTRRTESCSRR